MKIVALLLLAACSSGGATHPVSNHAPPTAADAMPENPNIVNGRIIRYEQVGTEQILTINKGTKDGIDHLWRAKLVLDNGASVVEVIVIRVDTSTSMLKTMGPVRVDVPRTTVRFEIVPADE